MNCFIFYFYFFLCLVQKINEKSIETDCFWMDIDFLFPEPKFTL